MTEHEIVATMLVTITTMFRCPCSRRVLFLSISGLVFGMVFNSLFNFLQISEFSQTPGNVGSTSLNAVGLRSKLYLHHNVINTKLVEQFLQTLQLRDARRDAQEVRVLCWVMTTLTNHEVKAKHVKRTWGQHCNLLVFISDHEDASLPAMSAMNTRTGRSGLWGKTMFGFTHVHDKYRGQYDWVYKADDDTFAIIENLRRFLLPHSPDDSIYFGFRYKSHVTGGYMSGGPGYVLSRRAVSKVVQVFKHRRKGCPNKLSINAEDINIAKCLDVAGVKTGDSRDLQGRHRFLPFAVASHVNPEQNNNQDWWFWKSIHWPIRAGYACCSPDPVSFHYISPAMQHFLYFLVYKVNPVSVNNLAVATPPSHILPQPYKACTKIYYYACARRLFYACALHSSRSHAGAECESCSHICAQLNSCYCACRHRKRCFQGCAQKFSSYCACPRDKSCAERNVSPEACAGNNVTKPTINESDAICKHGTETSDKPLC